MLKRLLAHPLTRGIEPDDFRAILLRSRIIVEKKFLRKLYEEWYGQLLTALPDGDGCVLELGSGGGFLRQMIPGLITSDVVRLPNLSAVLDAHRLPFRGGEFRAIVMVDVLHHLPRPGEFLSEAGRCVRPGGAIIMVEPWVTDWSRFVYTYLHHEPFDPEATEWTSQTTGPLAGANGALPWIILWRDRHRFLAEFPEWNIKRITLGMPFCYLFSGGVSLRSFLPGIAYRPARLLERLLEPWMDKLALLALIELQRTEHSDRSRLPR
jgi:SAM-dependent methyltransferase